MAMGVKDFEALATVLAKSRPPETAERPQSFSIEMLKARDNQWAIDVHAVMDACQQVNPRFDRDRFMDWINDKGRARPGK